MKTGQAYVWIERGQVQTMRSSWGRRRKEEQGGGNERKRTNHTGSGYMKIMTDLTITTVTSQM